MKIFSGLLLAVTTSLMMANSNAMVSLANNISVGQPYVGAKFGQFDLDDEANTSELDKPTAYGVYAGLNLTNIDNVGVEVEYITSSDADITSNGIKGEYDMSTIGVYGTYRYPFANNLYAKGKLGVARSEAKANFTDGETVTTKDTGIAGGIGLGYQLNSNIAIEGEYDIINNDDDASLLTIGAHFLF